LILNEKGNMMNSKDRLDLAKWIADYSLKSGASEAAVSISNSREVEISFRDKKLEKIKESTQNGLSLTIYSQNKYSNHSTNDIRKTSLKNFIEEAVASTKYLSKDEFRALPDPKYYAKDFSKEIEIFDENYQSITSDQRVKIAKELEAAASGMDERIISATSGYSDALSESVLVHSNGFEGQRKSTYFSAGVEMTVKDPNGARPEDWSWASARFFNDLPEIEKTAQDCAKRTVQKIGQAKIESGQYKMLVENRAGGRILSMLQGAISARAIQQKQSYLDGKLDEKIASEKLTIIDDPFVKRGLASRHYDGEGLSMKKRPMIQKGVLKNYYIDHYYGKKLGWQPNSGARTNLIFNLGSQSKSDMISAMDKGILVTGFLGGNSNATTGDFSFGIVGQLIENGKIVKPINEMNISGNALNFLPKLIEAGNDPYPYSSIRIPSLLFDEIHFSGL
jgi:PmbA protein